MRIKSLCLMGHQPFSQTGRVGDSANALRIAKVDAIQYLHRTINALRIITFAHCAIDLETWLPVRL